MLLPLLLEKGIPSNVKEVRGLAVGTLTAAVKAAGAPQVSVAAVEVSVCAQHGTSSAVKCGA